MPIHVVEDDLFSLNAHTIVNPVNCVGVMGKGLAKQFARRFPDHEVWYKRQCADGLIVPGCPQLDRGSAPWILAFPTKAHWRDPSRAEWIREGLISCRRRLPGSGVLSLAMPALGCGLGGLPFDQVRQMTERYLGDLTMPIWLIPPQE